MKEKTKNDLIANLNNKDNYNEKIELLTTPASSSNITFLTSDNITTNHEQRGPVSEQDKFMNYLKRQLENKSNFKIKEPDQNFRPKQQTKGHDTPSFCLTNKLIATKDPIKGAQFTDVCTIVDNKMNNNLSLTKGIGGQSYIESPNSGNYDDLPVTPAFWMKDNLEIAGKNKNSKFSDYNDSFHVINEKIEMNNSPKILQNRRNKRNINMIKASKEICDIGL